MLFDSWEVSLVKNSLASCQGHRLRAAFQVRGYLYCLLSQITLKMYLILDLFHTHTLWSRYHDHGHTLGNPIHANNELECPLKITYMYTGIPPYDYPVKTTTTLSQSLLAHCSVYFLSEKLFNSKTLSHLLTNLLNYNHDLDFWPNLEFYLDIQILVFLISPCRRPK